jgi:hypothetical protein
MKCLISGIPSERKLMPLFLIAIFIASKQFDFLSFSVIFFLASDNVKKTSRSTENNNKHACWKNRRKDLMSLFSINNTPDLYSHNLRPDKKRVLEEKKSTSYEKR